MLFTEMTWACSDNQTEYTSTLRGQNGDIFSVLNQVAHGQQ